MRSRKRGVGANIFSFFFLEEVMVVYFQLISGRARSNKHFKVDITKIVL